MSSGSGTADDVQSRASAGWWRWRVPKPVTVLAAAAANLLVVAAVPVAAEPAPQNAEAPRESGTSPSVLEELGALEGVSGAELVEVSQAIIDNGTVQLGVNAEGHLNVPGGSASSGTGTTRVGLRFLPTGAEATAPGCLCEGWGVADASSGVTGYANVATDGVVNIVPVSLRANSSTAESVVEVGAVFRVTHRYEPSGNANLYQATVSIENVGSTTVDTRYRRVMDWDVEPTAFAEYVTAHVGDSPWVLANTNNGFDTANPLSPPNVSGFPFSGDFVDAGPDDHGALFDFGFGPLDPGETKSFRIYYGAAGNEMGAALLE